MGWRIGTGQYGVSSGTKRRDDGGDVVEGTRKTISHVVTVVGAVTESIAASITTAAALMAVDSGRPSPCAGMRSHPRRRSWPIGVGLCSLSRRRELHVYGVL